MKLLFARARVQVDKTLCNRVNHQNVTAECPSHLKWHGKACSFHFQVMYPWMPARLSLVERGCLTFSPPESHFFNLEVLHLLTEHPPLSHFACDIPSFFIRRSARFRGFRLHTHNYRQRITQSLRLKYSHCGGQLSSNTIKHQDEQAVKTVAQHTAFDKDH